MSNRSNSWVFFPQPNSQAKVRLFCFPYAGAGALIYRAWASQLSPSIEVCAIELPGRGSRLMEPPYLQLSGLVEAIAHALQPYLDQPFALFGHSMGALISFELARWLRHAHQISPIQLLVSGRRAPQLPPDPAIHNLPEPEFLAELRRLNGTPTEALNNAELMELFLPILRADFTLIETYEYQAGPPLDCPIVALGGWQDPKVSRDHLQAWQVQTSADFALRMFPGDHFFLHSAQSLLLNTLLRSLYAQVE